MSKSNKKKTLYILLIGVISITIALLILAAWNDGLKWIVNSEKTKASFRDWLVVILSASLPILLIALTVFIRRRRKVVAGKGGFGGIGEGKVKVELEKKQETDDNARFFMLSQTDEQMKTPRRIAFNNTITLKELCERFRNFAASKLHLYYEESDIRQFIAGMSVSHILVMQGMSGTGKTSLAYAFGEFLSNHSTIVPIQPMWKERTDLIGYYNEFTKKFNETVLLQKMYEANYSDELYVTVLDEMNIARVEYYFAEFLSLLEIPNAEGRYLDVITDVKKKDPKLLKNGRLKLPVNMWFIGTANNDDSTFAISDKVYDRAMIMNLDKKSKWFDAPQTSGVQISIKHWERLVKEAIDKYKITYRNRKRIQRLDDYMIKHFHITFGNRIMKQINQYVPVMIACGGDEVEAIDDILAKKVLRKLESQNPIYVRNAADGLRSYLDELFGQDKMQSCKAYLTRLEHNA